MRWKKPVVSLKILKKDVKDITARSGKPKTSNNRPTNARLCPRISKNTPTKEGQNKPENTKTDLKPFMTILGTSQRATLEVDCIIGDYMVKIAFFHNECAPYRMPLFEGISKLPNIDLKVYFGRYRSSSRRWNVELNVNFNYEMLKEINALASLFSFNPEDDPNPINPSLFFKLLSNKYDVFIGGVPHYFGTLITFLVSKILRKPFIVFLEDIDFKGEEIASYLKRFLNYPFWKMLAFPFILIRFVCFQIVLRHSDGYVVPGTATKEFLLRRGISPSKIFTALNVVDNHGIEQERKESLKRNNTEKLKEKLGLKNKKVILSVAYLLERKGLQYLIQACAKLKKEKNDFMLVIVGDGPYKQELRRISTQNNLKTIFAGYVSNLVDYYLIADVFVLPTLHDVWGFAINEAMLCGCPIITTYNAGASKDLVKNETNGYIIEPGNVLELYRALKSILYNDKLKQKMKRKSEEIMQNFSYEKSIQGYGAAIDYVLGKQ